MFYTTSYQLSSLTQQLVKATTQPLEVTLLNLGALINSTNIQWSDPTSDQFWILVSMDIKAWTKYLKDLQSQLEEHNVTGHLQWLLHQCMMTNTYTATTNISSEHWEITTQLYQFAQHAETRYKRVGPRPYSTTLAIAGKTLQIAQQEYTCIRRGGAHSDEADNRQGPYQQSKQNFATAQQPYDNTKKQASNLKESEQQLKVEEYAWRTIQRRQQ